MITIINLDQVKASSFKSMVHRCSVHFHQNVVRHVTKGICEHHRLLKINSNIIGFHTGVEYFSVSAPQTISLPLIQ